MATWTDPPEDGAYPAHPTSASCSWCSVLASGGLWSSMLARHRARRHTLPEAGQ